MVICGQEFKVGPKIIGDGSHQVCCPSHKAKPGARRAMGRRPVSTPASFRSGPLFVAFKDYQRLRIAGDDTLIHNDLGDVIE